MAFATNKATAPASIHQYIAVPYREAYQLEALLWRSSYRCTHPSGNLSSTEQRSRPLFSTPRTKSILHLRGDRIMRSSASSKGRWSNPMWSGTWWARRRRRGLKPPWSGDWCWTDPLAVGAQGLE